MNVRKNCLGLVIVSGILVLSFVAAQAATHTVTTVAGGYLGDGKLATSGSFANPTSVARDSNGNIYVSDTYNCRIRKISKAGFISTYAGTGFCGYSGDGGPATSAMLANPYSVTVDGRGNVLFADQENERIRMITPAGIITTIAGNGTFGYSGDGGPAVNANLAAPTGISIDPTTGKIYIADGANYVIRMVDAAGIIHTVAGNHVSGFSGDGGPATSAQIRFANSVFADRQGNFYIADSGNLRIRKVSSTGTITTYAGNGQYGNGGSGGPATAASLGYVQGVFLNSGKLYISTGSNIWAVALSSRIINIVAGSSNGATGYNGDGNLATSTLFLGPWGMSPDGSGGLIVADSQNSLVREIDSSQSVATLAGQYVGDGGPATSSSLNSSFHLAFDSASNLYIADTDHNRIRKITPTGEITTFAGTGISGYSGDGGPATSATLYAPRAVTADGQGNIYIADTGNNAIRKVDSSGTITTFVTQFSSPTGGMSAGATALAMGPDGNLYATDGIFAVWKVTPSATTTIVAGVLYDIGYNGDGIPATQAWLSLANGLAFDSNGNLYICDWLNNRIRKVDSSGMISTVAGNGTSGFGGDGGPATSAMLSLPEDVAFDRGGNLYIADWVNFRVRVVDPSGTIETYAGSGGFGYNGNNLPAVIANIFPNGLAIKPNGVVFFSDQSMYRVRKIH